MDAMEDAMESTFYDIEHHNSYIIEKDETPGYHWQAEVYYNDILGCWMIQEKEYKLSTYSV